MNILGISAFYHDSAACLVTDGKIIAAAQEERFTRKKQDARFPIEAVKYCLKEGQCKAEGIDYIVFYEKPFIKFERLLETYLSYAPKGIRSFLAAMPIWMKEKMFQRLMIQREMEKIDKGWKNYKIPLLFTEHHQSHAASAFFPSPFERALVLTADGVGEWATTSVSLGNDNDLQILKEIQFPHSLGLLYSAFTYYTGFKVNSGEYKVMGLAPYGNPKYIDTILENLIDLREDGSFKLNMDYFAYCTDLKMVNDKFCELFGGPARKGESQISQKEMDLAASIQSVIELAMIRNVNHLYKEHKEPNLCLAGGVALNCVANGKILRETPVEKIWVQPAAGDAGGAVGAALATWYQFLGNKRQVDNKDLMRGSYLGPEYGPREIENFLEKNEICFEKVKEDELSGVVSDFLLDEKVVGWHQGRMEFGPRALGGRSILGDPRSQRMQSIMNLKIKYRESFRPFAPAVLADHVDDWFEYEGDSPYMLMVAKISEKHKIEMTDAQKQLFGIEKLNVPRSSIPAVTHVDYSARLQTVHGETNPKFHSLLSTFYKKTGCPILVNTSFNVRGEPIVCSPEDSYRCFMRTEMDALVIGNYVMRKENQKPLVGDSDWKNEFELD